MMEVSRESLKAIEEMCRWSLETRTKMAKVISEESRLRLPIFTDNKVKLWQQVATAFGEFNKTAAFQESTLSRFALDKAGVPVRCLETVMEHSLK